MSKPLHLDLLKEEERLSSNPVRLRVMLPLLSVLAAIGCLLWWSLLALRSHELTATRTGLQNEIEELKPAHTAVLTLRAQQRELTAAIRQLSLYQRSRLRFGEALTNLADHVPENIQLTELQVPPPPPALIDSKRPELGPTNSMEQVVLRLSGRTSGSRASISVDALLAALRTPVFTNLFQNADIPKGSFRQDAGRTAESRDTLLFEITCSCWPRRFE